MPRHIVAAAAEVPPGTRKLFTVDGRPVVVFNLKGEFFALLNRCPHQGASLCDGVQVGLVEPSRPGEFRLTREGEIVRCPWHGWEFDIRTGQSWFDPGHTKVRAYRAELAHGSALVEEPLQATSFPVSVEQDYIVVEL